MRHLPRNPAHYAVATALAAIALAACSSSTSGLPAGADDDSGSTASNGDGASQGDDTSDATASGSSGGSSKDGGGHPSDAGATTHADGSSSGVQYVDSGVLFNSAGLPFCGPNMTMPCDLTKDTCCVDVFGTGTCTTGHATCGASGGSFECLQQSDCPTGSLCCGFKASSMSAGSKCQNVADAGGQCGPAGQTAQLCQTNEECANGVSCVPQACNVGASLPANLTLCGLQQTSSYNCTTR